MGEILRLANKNTTALPSVVAAKMIDMPIAVKAKSFIIVPLFSWSPDPGEVS
jgi:hypothetical protein